MQKVLFLFVSFFSLLSIQQSSKADLSQYYIGRDARPVVTTGTYSGLANPNFNRLTMLWADPVSANPSNNHYHSKGVYSYFGPNTGATTGVNPWNGLFGTANIVPESPLIADILMRPGTGAFSGMLRTGFDDAAKFSNLEMRGVDDLSTYAPGTSEQFMFNSSGNRWSGLMAGSNISWELLNISPGLSIHDQSGTTIMSAAGQSYNLGNVGATGFRFKPIFAVSDSATPGTDFTATFKLTDSSTANAGSSWLEGGQFQIQVTAVPEPTSIGLLVVGLVGIGVASRLKRGRKLATNGDGISG